MKAGIALSLILGLSAVAAEPPAPPELAPWVRRAADHPQAMLAELERRWPARLDPAQARDWWFAKGEMLIAADRLEAAEGVAAQLATLSGGSDHAWLLRALALDRQGRPSASLAARALAGFEPHCRRGDEARSVAQGCDFRAAGAALRLLERDQTAQGGALNGEQSLRFATALAVAGRDAHLSALNRALLALNLQGQDRPDEARAELLQAQQEAQGDTYTLARLRSIEAVMLRRAGQILSSQAALESGLELAEQADAPRLVAQLRTNLVDAHMHQGRLKQALQQGQLALPVLQRYRDRFFERGLRHNLAVASIKLGQFEAARRELARVAEFETDPSSLLPRAAELRELAEAWGQAGQHREALVAYHAEHELSQRAHERTREAALEALSRKYDSAAKQRDLELLARDGALKDQQLANRRLAQKVSVAVAALLLLSLGLAGVLLLRSRRAQSELQANQHLLRTQSQRDPLTHLSNRRHFLAVMEQRTGSEFHGALLMIDIDHFKRVNDQHGHAAGDAVIVEVARRIREAVRASDLAVRWGGEEFLVFAPELPVPDLNALAERILNGIAAQPVSTPEQPLSITASLGFASFPLAPGLGLHWEQAINWADMALYKAKAEGRNRAVGILGIEGAGHSGVAGEALQDFDAACQRGEVRLATLLGPEPQD